MELYLSENDSETGPWIVVHDCTTQIECLIMFYKKITIFGIDYKV